MPQGETSRTSPGLIVEGCVRNLREISSSYGQLVYLAALRNPDNGRYESFAAEEVNRETTHRFLKQQHETVFREWITLSLEKKMADVELYLAGINRGDQAEIIDAWLRLTPYKNLVPGSIQGPERWKHVSDFEAILGLLKNVYGVASPDPCG